jgi:hypothetical protein
MPSERSLQWVRSWYDPSIKLTTEDWQYIGYLALACLNAFGIGLLLGLVIILAL